MYRLVFIIGLYLGLSQICQGAVVHSASVEIKNGFVILYASVNGVDGQYIFDSGAPGLIVNKKYTDTQSPGHTGLQGIHGYVETAIIPHWNFLWNGFTAKGAEAYSIDLTYIENAVDQRIDGLVGIDVFDGYYILIDYTTQSLQLWSSMPDRFKRTAYVELQVEMQGHVPVVILDHGESALRFAFDSGSGAHILDNETLSRLNADVTFLSAVNIVGADQKIVRTRKIETYGLSSKGIALPPTNFVLTDLSSLKDATKTDIDGILGQPLFVGRMVLIDRDRKFLRLSQIMGTQL